MRAHREYKKTKRLRILSESEIKDLFDLPKFNTEERSNYFSLNEVELQEMQRRRSLGGKIYFILQLGYFKCTHYFLNFTLDEARRDAQYVLKKYFQDQNCINHELRELAKTTYLFI